MSLSEFVNINIAAGTTAPTQKGFGDLLVLAHAQPKADREYNPGEVRSYVSLQDVASDFDSWEFPYRAAQTAFSQSPRPEKIMVALMDSASVLQKTNIDLGDIVSGQTVSFTVTDPGGMVVTGTASGITATAAAIDMAAQLDGMVRLSAAVPTTPLVVAIADDAGAQWNIDVESDNVGVYDASLTFDYDTKLDAVVNTNPGFYGIVVDNNSADNMARVAAWALAAERIAFFGPQFNKATDYTSARFTVPGDLADLQANPRAVQMFTRRSRVKPIEVAFAASNLVEEPGTITWMFKQLEGIGADKWSTSDVAALTAAGGNVYRTQSGIDITFDGKATSGEFIDVTRSIDWMQSRIQERIFGIFAINKKIAYTDIGVQAIKAEINAVLTLAEARNVIDAGWSVSIPTVLSQTPADRAARTFKNITFEARLAGAVHKVTILGTVSV